MFPGSVHIFGCSKIDRPILEIYKPLTDTVQGADDKLGQFLDQDIEASAYHRSVLRHSLESCSSVVSPNLNKLSIFTKICRQSTKLVQQS
jgi:hypothetical protein